MEETLSKQLESTNPWTICTSVGIDNTSVNIGTRNSLKTRIVQRNSAIYFSGCPCHVLHNAAQKCGTAFARCCGFDAEEFAVDLYYWFDKSTKRKNELKSYNEFCNQEYRSMIKHVSTCWLTLELAIERSLKQYPGLKSYFLPEDESQARFSRLQTVFGDPIYDLSISLSSISTPGVQSCQQVFATRRAPHSHTPVTAVFFA